MSPQKKASMPKIPKPDEASRAFFQSLVPERPDVKVKPMFGNVSAFVNGNMFMGLFGSDLFVRLPDSDREKLMKAGGGPLEPMPGRPMREYVILPATWRKQPKRIQGWVDRSLAWAQGLPPK
jgi:TfoX/Sxy family transcriptional regulator of competence genes